MPQPSRLLLGCAALGGAAPRICPAVWASGLTRLRSLSAPSRPQSRSCRRAAAPGIAAAGGAGVQVTEPFLMRALLGGMGLALVAAPLGCFVVWRRMAYFGEAVAQSGMIGIAVGLALAVNLTTSVLVVTLAVSGLLVLLGRQNLVPIDTLLGLVAHAALALGVITASLVQGPQLDLMTFLFGDIFAISRGDLRWIYFGGIIALGVEVWLWRPLLAISVHEDLAAAEGTRTESFKLVFVLLLALVVAIAIKI